MAKKEKVQLHHSDDLESVDAQLAAAMEALDQSNEKVLELLQEYAPPPQDATAVTPETPFPQDDPGDTAQ